MAKSKSPRLFKLDDGRTARFDLQLFHHECTEKIKDFQIAGKSMGRNRERNRMKGAHKQFGYWLVEELYHPTSEIERESLLERVKQWYYGYNGPSDLNDIYKLAEIFEMKRPDAFLKYENKGAVENMSSSMQTKNTHADGMKTNNPVKSTDETETKPGETNWRLRYRTISDKERETAHELYCMFVDLIAAYIKADTDVWVGLDRGTPEWIAACKSYPKRVPVYRAIQKSSFYIPYDTRMAAYGLLEEMYGGRCFDWEEPDPSEPWDEFSANKWRQFEAYLIQIGKDPKSEENLKDSNLFTDFIFEQLTEWDFKLDDVFSDYIED